MRHNHQYDSISTNLDMGKVNRDDSLDYSLDDSLDYSLDDSLDYSLDDSKACSLSAASVNMPLLLRLCL